MKILIIGAGGLLGAKVLKEAVMRGCDVYAAARTPIAGAPKPLLLDVTDKRLVLQTIRKVNPEVIINTAAFTDVDKCEVEKNVALEVNANAVGYISEAASQVRAYFLHVSTDYVFDGEKGMYIESDPPNPINFYGYTKLLGEEKVRNLARDWCIVRTSALFGWGIGAKLNFATWVINGLRSGHVLNIATDQYVSPTFNTDLARLIMEIADKRLTGIFHVAGSERASRYQMAITVSEIFGLNRNLIRPVPSSLLGWKARRPRDSSLNIGKFTSELKLKNFNLSQALTQMREEEVRGGL
ncbi:MAG: dTDP-4-dehydrorhamnose reductase [Candidatus Bathyarchaeia archaeon]